MRFIVVAILTLVTAPSSSAQDRYGSSETPPPFSDLGDAFAQPISPPAQGSSAGSDSRYGTAAGQSSAPRQPSGVAPLEGPRPPQQSGHANPLWQPAAAPLAPRQTQTQAFNTPPQPRQDLTPPAGPLASSGTSQANSLRTNLAANDPRAERAGALMQAMLTPPSNSQLTGPPLTLAEVVAGAPTRGEQTRRIDAYGDLCSSVADYYLGLLEAEALRRLQRKLPAASNALRQAEAELNVRVGTSQKAAVASQERLASMMGRSTPGLPGDLPYCGAYDTKYDQIFAGGGPLEAQHLDELLPLRFQELLGAYEAVGRAESWVDYVSKQPSETGAGMIRALELLALNRRAFVQIARDYNRRITRYTELSRPGRIDNGRLVAMLIGRSGARLSSVASGSGVTFRSPSR